MSCKVCAVGICKNNSKAPNLSFHRFPRDKKLRKIWVSKCRRKDKFNADTSRICSAHFKPDEFKRDFQAELLGSRPKAILKPNVIPTLNLTRGNSNLASDARHRRMLERNVKENHDKLVESALAMTSTPSEVPGSVCSVATCEYSSVVSKHSGDNVEFFSFPKDAKLRLEWVKRCSQPEMFDTNNKRVCSKHFKPNDFKDAIEAKIQNRLPKLLKPDCIPSLNLKPKKILNVNPCDTKSPKLERAAKSKHKAFIKRIVEAEKEQDLESENIAESDDQVDDIDKRGVANLDQNDETAKARNLELERRISQFISSKVQILFAELL